MEAGFGSGDLGGVSWAAGLGLAYWGGARLVGMNASLLASGGIRGEAPPAPLMYPPTVQAPASRIRAVLFISLSLSVLLIWFWCIALYRLNSSLSHRYALRTDCLLSQIPTRYLVTAFESSVASRIRALNYNFAIVN